MKPGCNVESVITWIQMISKKSVICQKNSIEVTALTIFQMLFFWLSTCSFCVKSLVYWFTLKFTRFRKKSVVSQKNSIEVSAFLMLLMLFFWLSACYRFVQVISLLVHRFFIRENSPPNCQPATRFPLR